MRTVFNEITGTELLLPETVERIISFSPAVTETLFLLGLGDAVVGVSPYCVRPREARNRRKVGSYNTARPELLKELQPDLIFTVTGYQRKFAMTLAKSFPVYPLELPVSVAGILDFVGKVGLVAGVPSPARRLVRELMETLVALPAHPRVSVYVEIDFGEPVTFGTYSYITDGLHLLGARNIFREVSSEWLTPPFEEVTRANPDFLLYEAKMYADFEEADLQALLEARGWTELRAVREGNVLLMPRPHDFLAHHGPSFISVVLPWLSERFQKVARP